MCPLAGNCSNKGQAFFRKSLLQRRCQTRSMILGHLLVIAANCTSFYETLKSLFVN